MNNFVQSVQSDRRLSAAGHARDGLPITPAELISSYRLKHGEVRVRGRCTLARIALEAVRERRGGEGPSKSECLGSVSPG